MEQDFVARTALDEMVESDRNQMLKAMIPYLPASGQQFLSMYAKTQELINTMTLFKNRKNYPDMQAASLSMSDPMEILQDIRRCCGGEKRRQIDQITNLIAVMQMIKIIDKGVGTKRVLTLFLIAGTWIIKQFVDDPMILGVCMVMLATPVGSMTAI